MEHNDRVCFQRILLTITYLSSLQLVLCRLEAVQFSPDIIIVQIIFTGPLGSLILFVVI